MNADTLLRALRPDRLPSLRRVPFDAATLREAERIVEHVRSGGEPALRACAERLDGLDRGSALVIEPSSLKRAAEALPIEDRRILERSAERIRRFAEAQRAALRDFELVSDVGGGDITMGQRVLPLSVVGCYAPGGRYPLPS